MVRIGIFLVVSAAIVILSWRSLIDSRSHGFYRFFAFEFLIALILLNSPLWFEKPLLPRQLLSWLLGAISIVLAAEGFRLLHVVGRPAPNVGNRTDLAFERTTALVTVGAYRLIRHPLYGSLLALVWCAYLKAPTDLYSIVLALGVTGFLVATAQFEERENLIHFGPTYKAYMQRTWRFLPFLF